MNCYEMLSKEKKDLLENRERKTLKSLEYDILQVVLSKYNRDETIKNWKLNYNDFYTTLYKAGFI